MKTRPKWPRAAVPAGLLVFQLLVFGGGIACARRGPRAASRTSVVALVGDRPVEFEDYALYVRRSTGEEPRAVSPAVASSLLDQYLEERLLELAIEKRVPDSQSRDAAERRRVAIAKEARLEELTVEELRREYDAHPERYDRPPVLKVSQLLLPTREKAEMARKRLSQGIPWLQVSKELSVAPNAPTGGELGFLARSDLPREFEKAIFGQPAGGVTPILAAPHGFHIFRVDERVDRRIVTFEEAAPGLRLALSEKRSGEAVARLLAEARLAYPVKVVESHLPFPYVGSGPSGGAAARRSLDSTK